MMQANLFTGSNGCGRVINPDAAPAFTGRNVYFIGIGGCGMNGLARMLKQLGAICSGSDAVDRDLIESLRADGIQVNLNPDENSLPASCDVVIASAAILSDHPELTAARKRSMTVMNYAEALGWTQINRTGVSIAGTHGKSTVSAMLCHVLIEAGLDPGFIIGATCKQIGGGCRVGAKHIPLGSHQGEPGILVAEACEYNRSFHHHHPHLALINNVEEDHLDVYENLENVIEAFAVFARLLPDRDRVGRLLIAYDGAHRDAIVHDLKCHIDTFGMNPAADFVFTVDVPSGLVQLYHQHALVAQWTNRMRGEHHAHNSTAAAIMAHHLGASWEQISRALTSFAGLDRRMQRLGEKNIADGRVVVYDDYGHHPTEIDATLRALREAECPKRLICVFQPHQHSRTRFMMQEFANSFTHADVVIVPHIYFVRDSELEMTQVSAIDLVDQLRHRGVAALHVHPFEAIVEQLHEMCRDGDLVVIMGAGPVGQVAHQYFNQPAPRPAEIEST